MLIIDEVWKKLVIFYHFSGFFKKNLLPLIIMKSIFEYLEYRDFLKDHYEFNKQRFPFFSYRYITAKTGLDASFYVKVLQKQIHLSEKALDPLCQFLKLNKKEIEYFRLLVRFNKVTARDETRQLFEKLIELREPKTQTLDAAKYEFFSKWYYIAIRELLNFYRFTGDYKKLAAKLDPPITASEARHAVELLKKLSLVRERDDGSLELTEQFVTTGESWNSIAIENFQKESIRLAGESIERISRNNRETSTVTISMSVKGFTALKERLREMRKELLEMARQDETPNAVFQVNFQIFPLTDTEDGKK
jgi:uncharacterized protein (TIGR02147 family)